MATFNVPPPENFNFSRPEEYEQWSIRFNRFSIASGLTEKSEDVQVNTLLYCMGKNADDILICQRNIPKIIKLLAKDLWIIL